jgi:OPA family glycerol-3-phosphate transporter-like MFS transporter
MLWPPMIRLMAANMTDEEYSYSAVRIYVASSLATLVLYVISPILLNFTEWNGVILFTSFIGLAITVIWMVYGTRAFNQGNKPAPSPESELVKDIREEKSASSLPRTVTAATVLIILAIIFHGALRDGVGDWMPTFMASSFDLDPKSAIIAGVVPALFSILSTSVFEFIHRKLISNEVACAGAIFGVSAAVCSLLLMTNLVGASGWLGAAVSALLLAMVSVCMHGVNFMLITIVPKRFAKRGRVSSASGFINASTYLGSAIALPLFPAIEKSFSWSVTIGVWVAISVAGSLLCFAASSIWRKFMLGDANEVNSNE